MSQKTTEYDDYDALKSDYTKVREAAENLLIAALETGGDLEGMAERMKAILDETQDLQTGATSSNL